MKGSWEIGRVAGIGISIHWTFLLLVGYIVFSGVQQGFTNIEILWSVGFLLSLFVMVVLHELGHSLAARKFGIRTRSISLLPIGGVASLERIPEKPAQELWVAIAGPLVNIGAVLLLLPFMDLEGMAAGSVTLSPVTGHNFLANFFVMNASLAMFNLVPAFPMDGGRVLRALLAFRYPYHVATKIAARIGQFLALGFILLGFYANPFLIFIGLFIIMGAQNEANQAQAKFVMKDLTVARALMRNIGILRPAQPLEDAVQLLLEGQARDFIVVDEGKIAGILNREDIIRGLSRLGAESAVRESMKTEFMVLDSRTPLAEAHMLLQQSGSGFAPVTTQGVLAGGVDTENILEVLMLAEAGYRRS